MKIYQKICLRKNCPDFHGFKTNEEKIKDQAPKPKSNITFRQLIDQTTSKPSTMLTSIVNTEKVTNAAGQRITVFTTDQQLYGVVFDIMWVEHYH